MSAETTPAIERGAQVAAEFGGHPGRAVSDYWREHTSATLAAALDVEELAATVDAHRPVTAMRGGYELVIVGCQCMDRVFFAASETWGSHITTTLRTHLLGGTS